MFHKQQENKRFHRSFFVGLSSHIQSQDTFSCFESKCSAQQCFAIGSAYQILFHLLSTGWAPHTHLIVKNNGPTKRAISSSVIRYCFSFRWLFLFTSVISPKHFFNIFM